MALLTGACVWAARADALPEATLQTAPADGAATAGVSYPTVHWPSGANYTSTALFDPTANIGYFSAWTAAPNSLFKVDLSSLSVLSTLQLTTPAYLDAAVFNPTAKVAIFGGYYSSKFTKVDLRTFTQTGTLALSSSLNFPGTYSEAFDHTTQMAYFGSNSGGTRVKGQIIKIDTRNFSFVSSIPLLAGEAVINFLLIDPSRSKLYAGVVAGSVKSGTSSLIRIDLTTGTRTGKLSLPSTYIDWGVVDTTNNLAYVASYGTPTTLYKVDLASFTATGSILLSSPVISAGAIDTVNHMAIFASSNSTSTCPPSIS